MHKTSGKIVICACLCLCMLLTGCSHSGKVQVVDAKGRPVTGAKVFPITPSMNGDPVLTDAKGDAWVPLFMGQKTKWIAVSKTGFKDANVDAPKHWPLIITLKK